MKIIIEVKDVYGRRTIYPACPVSQAFAHEGYEYAVMEIEGN